MLSRLHLPLDRSSTGPLIRYISWPLILIAGIIVAVITIFHC
jgi:hypothetical protein